MVFIVKAAFGYNVTGSSRGPVVGARCGRDAASLLRNARCMGTADRLKFGYMLPFFFVLLASRFTNASNARPRTCPSPLCECPRSGFVSVMTGCVFYERSTRARVGQPQRAAVRAMAKLPQGVKEPSVTPQIKDPLFGFNPQAELINRCDSDA